MTDDSEQFFNRGAMPTGLKYAIAAGAFTVAGTAMQGDIETAASLSETLGFALLGLSVLEIMIPIAEFTGGRIGEWWRGRQSGVGP